MQPRNYQPIHIVSRPVLSDQATEDLRAELLKRDTVNTEYLIQLYKRFYEQFDTDNPNCQVHLDDWWTPNPCIKLVSTSLPFGDERHLIMTEKPDDIVYLKPEFKDIYPLNNKQYCTAILRFENKGPSVKETRQRDNSPVRYRPIVNPNLPPAPPPASVRRQIPHSPPPSSKKNARTHRGRVSYKPPPEPELEPEKPKTYRPQPEQKSFLANFW
jgi:hypothetical protein